MARRRPPAALAGKFTADDMPAELAVFDPDHWIGGNAYQKEQAWRTSRAEWVEKFKPVGLDPMREDGLKPDLPFDPYGPNGERHISFGVYSHL